VVLQLLIQLLVVAVEEEEVILLVLNMDAGLLVAGEEGLAFLVLALTGQLVLQEPVVGEEVVQVVQMDPELNMLVPEPQGVTMAVVEEVQALDMKKVVTVQLALLELSGLELLVHSHQLTQETYNA
jgi:hypothetical protein